MTAVRACECAACAVALTDNGDKAGHPPRGDSHGSTDQAPSGDLRTPRGW